MRNVNRKPSFPQERVEDGLLQRERIGRRTSFQLRDFAMWIPQDCAFRDFTHVDVGGEPVRMPGLIVDSDTTCATILDHLADAREVSVQQVHRYALNLQPAAAIDPRPPPAEWRDTVRAVFVVNLRGNSLKCFEVWGRGGSVIQAKIDVGFRCMGAE